MSVVTLLQDLYGVLEFTGLYSFEFVDKKRKPITEIFFMSPPKSKSMSEGTRSTTVPTLGSNYNLDAGNATKQIQLSGECYFIIEGSEVPTPTFVEDENLIIGRSGYQELLKLRWMLIRYRDYTMTSDGSLHIPTTISGVTGIDKLYKNISKRIKNKTGALYDEVRLIFHDYDFDDHWFCRVDNFSINLSADRLYVGQYEISLEGYEPDYRQETRPVTYKLTPEAEASVFINDLGT